MVCLSFHSHDLLTCLSRRASAVPRLLGKLLDQKSNGSTAGTCSTGGLSQSTLSSLALVVLGGGFASFVRTTMLNRAEDRIAARLRTNAFKSLLVNRDLEWFHMETVNETTVAEEQDKVDSKRKRRLRQASPPA